jgi:hypothetical protein
MTPALPHHSGLGISRASSPALETLVRTTRDFICEEPSDYCTWVLGYTNLSSMPPDTEKVSSSAPPASSQSSKLQRTLACVLCQQRKVKCDRKFPCANCLKFKAQCVPAALNARQRKRRFPERELLERIRKYEHLLRQNKITFEPLHKSTTGRKHPLLSEGRHDSDDERPMSLDRSSPSTSEKHREVNEVKWVRSLWKGRCMWLTTSETSGMP